MNEPDITFLTSVTIYMDQINIMSHIYNFQGLDIYQKNKEKYLSDKNDLQEILTFKKNYRKTVQWFGSAQAGEYIRPRELRIEIK